MFGTGATMSVLAPLTVVVRNSAQLIYHDRPCGDAPTHTVWPFETIIIVAAPDVGLMASSICCVANCWLSFMLCLVIFVVPSYFFLSFLFLCPFCLFLVSCSCLFVFFSFFFCCYLSDVLTCVYISFFTRVLIAVGIAWTNNLVVTHLSCVFPSRTL